jgi:hypothetical protein
MLITELSPSTAMAILPSSTHVKTVSKNNTFYEVALQRITTPDCRNGLVSLLAYHL